MSKLKFSNEQKDFTKGELLALLEGIPEDKLFWFTHFEEFTRYADELHTLGQIKEALGLYYGDPDEDTPEGYAYTFEEAYLDDSEYVIEIMEQRIRELKKGLPLCSPIV